MSALGDYVHLTWLGYKKWGISHSGDTPNYLKSVSSEKFLQNRLSSVSPVNEATINELRNRLSQNSDTSIHNDKQFVEHEFQDKINAVYQFLSENYPARVIGRLQGNQYLKTNQYNKAKESSLTTEEYFLNQDSLSEKQSILNQICNKINSINSKGSSVGIPPQELDELVQLYEKFPKLNKKHLYHSNFGKIQGQINNQLSDMIINHAKGDFGEAFVALCSDQAQKISGESLTKFLHSMKDVHIIGDIKTAPSVVKDQIYIKEDTKLGKILLKGIPTQNKVDCSITVNGEDIFASVKNYREKTISGKQYIEPHLQTVNLIYPLMFINQEGDYGNHWLNLHVAHIDNRVKERNAELEKLLKKEIAFEALSSGNPFKQGVTNANVFVVINSQKGTVFVKSISSLLKNYEYFHGLDDISSKIINNEIASSYEQRVENILNNVHQQKISVSLRIPISDFS